MEQRPLAYMGSEPHVFISYAHKDSQIVYPIIERLQQKGLRLWYDEGLEVGSSWGEKIPQQILASTGMICFVTRHFLESDNCLDETLFAKNKKKGPLIVYMEKVELPLEMEFQSGRLHALSLDQFPSTEALIEKNPVYQTAPALYRFRHNPGTCAGAHPHVPGRAGLRSFNADSGGALPPGKSRLRRRKLCRSC